jgi:hypothetical protein
MVDEKIIICATFCLEVRRKRPINKLKNIKTAQNIE